MNKTKLINTLGLAYRASKISLGTELILEEIKQNKTVCIFSALDESSDSFRKLKNKLDYYKIPLYLYLSKDDLAKITGKKGVSVISLNDKGFYSLVLKYEKEDN